MLAVSATGSASDDAPNVWHALELFATSLSLFVENQGQWSDESVRYLHSGRGAVTDEGVRFQLTREVAGDKRFVG